MEWISVEDELPKPSHSLGGTEFSDDVLVMIKEGVMLVDCVVYPHGIFGADTTPRFNTNYHKKERDITHWMPLPNPPNKGK